MEVYGPLPSLEFTRLSELLISLARRAAPENVFLFFYFFVFLGSFSQRLYNRILNFVSSNINSVAAGMQYWDEFLAKFYCWKDKRT